MGTGTLVPSDLAPRLVLPVGDPIAREWGPWVQAHKTCRECRRRRRAWAKRIKNLRANGASRVRVQRDLAWARYFVMWDALRHREERWAMGRHETP